LLDILRQSWDDEALDLAGISSDRLCPLVPSEKVVGGVSREAAAATRLPQGLAVVAGASDGGLANLGAGATQGGQVVLTVGTSGAIRKIVERPWLDPQERTWCYVFPNGLFFAGGAINNGGLALEWVRGRFYSELPAEEGYERMLEDAASVSPGADGVTMLPYFTGERSPHWTACARAVLHGLGMQHGREHFSRAALEGIAFCLADVWQALAPQGELERSARLTGGITQAPVWMQVVADVLGVPLSPLQAADASAVGAAILGHWALGNWESLSSRRLQEAALTDVLPEPGRHALYVERHAVFQSLFRLAQGLC
jgi:gluconokinase